MQWLYTGNIDDISTSPDRHQLDIYIRLWCLCASSGFDVPGLQDLAITRMKKLYRTFGVSFSANHIKFIYEHNDLPNVLRQHAIDAATHDLMATGPSATILGSSPAVEEPANKPRPSYTYRFTNHVFANDLLDNVLRYTGSAARAPHPFGPAPSPPSSSASLSAPTLFCPPSIHQFQPSITVSANPPPTPESTPERHPTGTGTGTGTPTPRERIRQRANDSSSPNEIRSRDQSGSPLEDPFGHVNEAGRAPNLEPEPEPEPNPEAEANANTAPTTQTET